VPTLAFYPCAPVLVPEAAQGAAHETAEVLAACDAAVRELTRGDRRVLVVGPGPATRQHPGTATGTLAGLGVPVTVGPASSGPGGGATAGLPMALTLGAWLLDRAGVPAYRRGYVELGPATDQDAADGRVWPDADAWLVMGDGSARLSERAPGGVDPRGAAYDEGVAAALASGDPSRLTDLDLREGAELLAAGAPVWSAVGAQLLATSGPDRRWRATVAAHEAPYGVSYLVATWA
jgi:hypothetical protein